MIGAAMLAILFRVNLPVALVTTLYTNPLTILPLYVLAYAYGAFVLGYRGDMIPAHLELPQISWNNWTTVLPHWFVSLGKPFTVGLPLLAITLAALGYVTVRVLWRWKIMREWNRRAARRRAAREKHEG
jgi:uncharacterized protein